MKALTSILNVNAQRSTLQIKMQLGAARNAVVFTMHDCRKALKQQ